MRTIKEMIEAGPNRFSRILGHATINGLNVRLRVRLAGIQAVVEYTDATSEADPWHKLGGNWSPLMPFGRMLDLIPNVAQFTLTPALLERGW